MGPARSRVGGEGCHGGIVTAAGAGVHGGHVHVVILLPEGLLLVSVDNVEVPGSGPGPPPPVRGVPVCEVPVRPGLLPLDRARPVCRVLPLLLSRPRHFPPGPARVAPSDLVPGGVPPLLLLVRGIVVVKLVLEGRHNLPPSPVHPVLLCSAGHCLTQTGIDNRALPTSTRSALGRKSQL